MSVCEWLNKFDLSIQWKNIIHREKKIEPRIRTLWISKHFTKKRNPYTKEYKYKQAK